MEQIEFSETSAYINQTPGNHPKENKQHSEHGESLKSREYYCLRRFEFVSAVIKKVIFSRMWRLFGKHVTIIFHLEEEGSMLLCNFGMFLQHTVASRAIRFQLSAYLAEGTVPEIKYRS